MNIYLNGQAIDTQSLNLADLLLEHDMDASVVATAIDGDFVPRSQYHCTPLMSGQKIEVLAPMQGG
ncbi:sulfur carrier protein ThiS [uncultured Acinetobacter sp.]|uniref:sulfur carrier protein ThiS n=1 Tax=uncultured Acinetobacter sp. TaxID=165433 RepID=UPI0026161437|nr:sulfur carrier protein ThiS [uncultured Acinetobacter sp.]